MEKEILKKLNYILTKNYKRKGAFLSGLGSIKGLCHNSKVSKKFEVRIASIIYNKTGVLWNRIRDRKRMRIYRRMHKICEKCGKKRSVHTHHIIPVFKGGLEKDENYRAVCKKCHIALHPELPKGYIK